MMKLMLSVLVIVSSAAVFAQTVSVKSPDGKNEIRLMTEPVLSYSVLRSGTERVAATPISMKIEGADLLGGAGTKVESADTVTLKGTIRTPLYKKASVDETANRTVVTFKGGWRVALVARNDGVAYRFETSFPGRVKVMEEAAGVKVPEGTASAYAAYTKKWSGDPLQCSWESIYTTVTDLKTLAGKDETVYLPLVMKYSDGAVMSVTESDLLDYPGWNMKRAAGEGVALEARMARYPVKTEHRDFANGKGSDEKPLRYIRVLERAAHLAETAGTRTYPWRVFMLADDESKLCEADIVYALAAPCRLKNTEWIRPGKVAWEWWNCWNVSGVPFRAGCNTATYEHYIDFAEEFGIEYVIMDEGWSEKLNIRKYNPDTDVEHLVKYANARGVGVILWCAWPQLVGRQHEVFSKFAKLGVKGFKIDFMDRDDQIMENYLEETAKIAAEYKLVLDYHGMHKPTGMSRTYPNILNYEGIHGLECMKWENGTDFMRNDLLGLYCRMSAGPMDYTPGAMKNMTRKQFKADFMQPGSQGTRVHQMALMALYEAPLQMLCDSPTQYLRNRECFGFMAQVPVVWDATVGLGGSMEKSAAMARRKGETWYAAAISSWDPCTMEIDTSFLGDGKWKAVVFEDGINADRDATDYVKKTLTVKAGEKIKIKMAPGGGWIARFERKGFFW